MKTLEEQLQDFILECNGFGLDTTYAARYNHKHISFKNDYTQLAWMFYTQGYWSGISEGKL